MTDTPNTDPTETDPTETDPTPTPDTPAAKPTRRRAAKKAPAKRTARPAGTDPKPVGRPSNDAKLADQIAEQLVTASLGLSALSLTSGNAVLADDADAVARHAHAIADSLVALGKQNPRVMKLLQGGVTGSAWFGVLVAVGALARDIAANHQAAAMAAAPTPAPVPFPAGPGPGFPSAP